jgi:hypothetical protein
MSWQSICEFSRIFQLSGGSFFDLSTHPHFWASKKLSTSKRPIPPNDKALKTFVFDVFRLPLTNEKIRSSHPVVWTFSKLRKHPRPTINDLTKTFLAYEIV